MPNPLSFILPFIGTSMTNSQNARLNRTVGANMEDKIQTGLRHGIHPLEAIGANVAQGPTIPMQNPLAHMANVQPEDPDAVLNRRIKEETLQSLKRDKEDYKWKYSIVKPATHPEMPGVKLWGFNPEYQMFGAMSQAIVIASNSEEAYKLLVGKLSPEEQRQAERQKKRIQKLQEEINERSNVGGPMP